MHIQASLRTGEHNSQNSVACIYSQAHKFQKCKMTKLWQLNNVAVNNCHFTVAASIK